MGKDFAGHIIGIRFFLDASNDAQSFRGSMRQAALRLALRQETLACFVAQRPLRFLSDFCALDRSLENAEDEVWAFRIIAHCADSLTYCFSHETKTFIQWKRLSEYCDQWMERKPKSFNPIFTRPARAEYDEYFASIWYLGPCHGKSSIAH